MPASLLARTFLLLALLVVLTTSAWLALFSHFEAEPRARETARLAASTVNLIQAALFAAAPAKRPGLFAELTTREGIRLLPAEEGDEIAPIPDTRHFRLLRQELERRLGPDTRVSSMVNGVEGFWVSFRLGSTAEDDYWLILPWERAARRAIGRQWVVWGMLAMSLALLAAWLIASRISQPLRAMARSVAAVGRGQTPAPLPRSGAREIDQLADAFDTLACDLARHEQDRSEVLAGISHDLRTPLTRLRLEAELSIADDAARQAVIADIGQMEGVIAQFMDYARADAGEPPTPTDLGPLLERTVARQQAIGRPLTANIGPLPALTIRPQALCRALDNLIDNAWKYGAGPVSLQASTVNGKICLEITDRGPGIPPTDTERVKRPFARLNTARSDVTGTGLGLAIVERCARLHGGQLELLPREGGGLIARLTLPGPATGAG